VCSHHCDYWWNVCVRVVERIVVRKFRVLIFVVRFSEQRCGEFVWCEIQWFAMLFVLYGKGWASRKNIRLLYETLLWQKLNVKRVVASVAGINLLGESNHNMRGYSVDSRKWAVRQWMSYNMPESLSALCKIVSLTAANTRRIFEVSVACVRLV